MPDAAFAPCAVIPVYDHERAVGRVVEALRAVPLPCILVDDGSGPACARELDRIAAALPEVALVRLPRNVGKGGAVSAGLRAALAHGYTHALQVDADGQHALADVRRFLEEGRAHPDSLVCGRPVFDASIPASRRYGRMLTHAFVWMWTFSLDIPDAMCGFRLYPLRPVVELLDRARLGSRMDFDVEILVRLHWRGQPMRWIDTVVSYPLDGLSHYRVFRDNLLMACMYARLLPGMLLRAPLLLWRRLR